MGELTGREKNMVHLVVKGLPKKKANELRAMLIKIAKLAGGAPSIKRKSKTQF